MHTSDALSHLHNLTDNPDNKDVIPLNFLQHFTPNYIEHAYLHWIEDLYVHKTKDSDTIKVKRKRGRLPKPNPERTNSKTTSAAHTHTTQPCQTNKFSNNEIISRDLNVNINTECKKSDRLTVTKLGTINHANK